MNEIDTLAGEQYCYLTTTGRKTGKAHTIEIWFAVQTGKPTVYMLSGGRGRSDWVKNLVADPSVQMRVRDQVFSGLGRLIRDGEEEQLARHLIVKKYYGRDRVASSGWEAESLPVAIDLSIT